MFRELIFLFFLQGVSQGSEESLERRSSLPRMKSYDAVVFEILRVSPDDFAVRSHTIYDQIISLFFLLLFFLIKGILKFIDLRRKEKIHMQ